MNMIAMVNVIFIPALVVALLSSFEIIIKKHLVEKMSHKMMVVTGSLFYFIFCLGYIGWHRNELQSEIKALGVPIILTMIFATMFGFAANIIGLAIMRYGQISIVTALMSTVPLFVAALAVLVLNEALARRHIAGIGAIVGGIFLLS